MKLNKWFGALIFLFLSFLIFWAGKGLLKYSFYETHDLKRQMVRGYDAVLTIREGHFPLRWAGLTNYECGVPTFNFYYPLFYYLIIAVNFFTGGVMFPIKIISFLSLALGTLSFYLWIKEETRNKWGALASSILYLYAPYRFSLIFVRGDPEYLSYAILPFVFYFFAKAFDSEEKRLFVMNSFWAAVFGGFLAISHNVVSVFVFPLIFIYLLAKVIKQRFFNRKKLLVISFAFISAVGLGAFFVFPATLEIRYTQIATPIFNYKDHFPALWQLLYSKWGYGDSAVGTALDGLSFQLGYAEWLALALVAFWFLIELIKKRINVNWFIKNIFIVGLFVLACISIYLMLPNSVPVWEKIGLSKVLDFPWRILGITVFVTSALFGFWVSEIKPKNVFWLLVVGVPLLALVGSRNYLLSQPVLESDLPFYKSIETFSVPRRSLPAFADNILPPEATTSCYLTTPVVSSDMKSDNLGFGEVKRGSTFGEVDINIDKRLLKGDKIIFNLSYFPEINFYLNGVRYNYGNCSGRVCVKISDLKNGENRVNWRVGQTFIEKASNAVSVLFIAAWICIIIIALRSNVKKKNI